MKKFRRLLLLLGLTVVTLYGLARLANVELTADTLAQVHWGWLGATMLLFFLAIFVRGMRWHRILRAMGWPTRFLYANTLLIAGLFISSVLPARLGDIGRVVMLKQDYDIPVSKGLASLAAERALDVFAILVLAAAGGLVALRGRIPAQFYPLMLVAAGLLLIGLIGLLASPALEQWLRNPLPRWQKTLDPERPGWPQRLGQYYQKALDFGFSMVHGVRALGRQPLALSLAVIESFFIWLVDGLLISLTLISIGASPRFSLGLFGVMISNLISAIPITPGAVGQFDAILYGILTVAGVNEAEAGLGVILLRVVSLWTLLPVCGLITYLFGFSRALNLSPTALPKNEPLPSASPLEG